MNRIGSEALLIPLLLRVAKFQVCRRQVCLCGKRATGVVEQLVWKTTGALAPNISMFNNSEIDSRKNNQGRSRTEVSDVIFCHHDRIDICPGFSAYWGTAEASRQKMKQDKNVCSHHVHVTSHCTDQLHAIRRINQPWLM